MSKNEICRYHNDLNKIQLPNLAELEQDLLFSIITRIRNKPAGTKFCFTDNDLRKMLKRNSTNEELFKIAHDLRYKFFKADFTIILPQDERGRFGSETINLFKTFRMWWHIGDSNTTLLLDEIELVVNERFEYLLNELFEKFTEFELAEFVSLSGKYTKRLYTHLKQFRTTGEWIVKWNDFKEILGIPANYRPCDIDTFILKPAIKELTAERTLLDQQRIPFKNLKYEKLTKNQNPNTRRLTPYFIRFTFTKQDSTKTLEYKLKNKIFEYKDKALLLRVVSIEKAKNKVVVYCYKLNKETLNLIDRKLQGCNFNNYEHAEQFILKNEYKIS